MATMVLSYAGGVIGTAIGGPVGGLAGRAVGALAGSYIDKELISAINGPAPEGGPKLSDLNVTSSSDGSPMPRVYGRARVAGQLIWATQLVEQQTSDGSGKGIGDSGSSAQATYLYYGNFAMAICEGPIAQIGRVWADSKELDLSSVTARIYYGDETQTPDSLIEAKQGAGNAPAYRGVAYVVFEGMPLKNYGNRVPQMTFEVFRPVGELETAVRAVTLIPAAGEFAYATTPIQRDLGAGRWLSENCRAKRDTADITVSLDHLKRGMPNVGAVSLFVAWFGNDLRAANCSLAPKVETTDKATSPVSWSVNGQPRTSYAAVSTHNGSAAYGGTPSDESVRQAIAAIRYLGLEVVFTPFIMMDIPAGNALPDPYRAGTPAGQAVYPWRGRITISPAPGVSGSPDQTGAAATQIAAFVTQYRAFILYYANLCAAEGGVDVFVIGSEMRGLTWARSAAGTFPFVDALVTLAADVKAILPDAKIVYAADWSEFTPYQTAQFGGPAGEAYFHLDPLWTSANIDAIGVDNYWPLADWRDGETHLDYAAGWRSVYDRAYLQSNIEGGEGYAWYYASQSARDAQTRTPITDATYGKPWVWRYKDLRNWWLNQHYNRPGGTESGLPTAWTPQSKPIWFMELGCPAIDRGSNQPNVFIDPKSSESFAPYYSSGARDDCMQRAHLGAVLDYYGNSAHNPTSSVYAGPMVDLARVFLYTWDARPYPQFPALSGLWGDAANWPTGHWLTGRMGEAPLSETVAAILDDAGFADYDVSRLNGSMQGLVLDRIMSPRRAIDPLSVAFFFDACESQGLIRFRHRGQDGSIATITTADMSDSTGGRDGALYSLTRAQETELPRAAKLTYIDGDNNYLQGSVEARRAHNAMRSGRDSQAQMPIVWAFDAAGWAAATLLHETWAAREKAAFRLPPSRLALDPGDVLTLDMGGRQLDIRLTEASTGADIIANAASHDASVYEGATAATRATSATEAASYGAPVAEFLDLPIIRGDETPYVGYVAAFSDPWPGAVAFYRSPDGSSYAVKATPSRAAIMGETLWDFYAGPTGRWDRGNTIQVQVYGGQLASATELAVLNGANIAAIRNADGQWEVFQFAAATLISAGVYQLSNFLRGQWGTELAMRSPVATGARFVLLDTAVTPVDMVQGDVGVSFSWKYGPGIYDYSHWTYTTVSKSFSGLGLKPFAPCHALRTRISGDDVITWIRRTRLNGDSWEQTEVPLGEDAEAYDVDIMNGSTVLRTLSVSSSAATYTAAQQTADWGGAAPGSLTVRIYQKSATTGRGWPLEAVV